MEDESSREKLITNEYNDGCPGCNVDRLKEENKGIPYKNFSFIWLVSLCTGSSFMVGRALTSIMWGVAADRFGRRPVILTGICSVVVFNTLFGLSSGFWMAVLMLFFLGCFNRVSLVLQGRILQKYVEQSIELWPYQPLAHLVVLDLSSVQQLVVSLHSLPKAGITALSWWFPETLHTHNRKRKDKARSRLASEGPSSNEIEGEEDNADILDLGCE